MNTPSIHAHTRRTALTLIACLALAGITPALSAAADHASSAALADKAKVLPLKASIEKDTSGKNEAPMVLHLTNESKDAVTVSTHIDLSVVVHNRPKSRSLPAQTIAPGAVMTIDNLAPDDKVTVTADGFEPLVVVIPYKP